MKKNSFGLLPLYQKVLVVLLFVYLFYGVSGYFVASPVIQQEIIKIAKQQADRDVEIGHFRFNPFANSILLENVIIKDEDGSDFVSFEQFYIDFELSSLFRWSWYFDQVHLIAPDVNIKQVGQDRFNFSSLIASDENQEQEDKSGKGSVIPAVSIGELKLEQGRFAFADQTRAQPETLSVAPVNFSLNDFSTRQDGAKGNNYTFVLTGPEGGRFSWQGNFSLEPLQTKGRLGLSGLDLTPFADFLSYRLRFSMPSGEMSIETDYDFSRQNEQIKLNLENGSVELSDLVIQPKDSEQPAISLPGLMVSGMAMDLQQQRLHMKKLELDQPEVRAKMGKEGLDLATLFVPLEAGDLGGEAGNAATGQGEAVQQDQQTQNAQQLAQQQPAEDQLSPQSTSQGKPSSSWSVLLDQLLLKRSRLEYQENTLAHTETAVLALYPLDLQLDNLEFSTDPNVQTSPFTFELDSSFDESGKLAVQGQGQLSPLSLSAQVQAEQFPVQLLEPWISESVNVRVRNGLVSQQMKLDLSQQDKETSIRLSGDAQLRQLQIYEASSMPLVALDRLEVSGLSLQLPESALNINDVLLSGLFVRNEVSPDGTTIGKRIARPVAAVQENKNTAKQPMRVQLKKLQIENTNVEYADYSISPNFLSGLYQLSGDIHGLDSRSSPASVVLQGKIDGYAPFSINGMVNPVADSPLVDLELFLQGMEMTSLTPYTGNMLGYEVEKGLLGVKTNLNIANNHLSSSSDISADQFFLGEKVESEDAIKAPIKLGLSVLRNGNGEIALPLKVEGDLDDPSFSARGIILTALKNVLVKAATSPFSVLGGLVGADDLDRIEFAQGSSEADGAVQQKLQKLADVLEKRPRLQLGLTGVFHKKDKLAYAKSLLGQELAQQAGLQWQHNVDSLLHSERFVKLLKRRYEKVLEEDYEVLRTRVLGESGAPSEPLPSEEQLKYQQQQRDLAIKAFNAIAEELPVGQEQLVQLAESRAKNAHSAMLNRYQVAPDRLLLLPAQGQPHGFSGVKLVLKD